MIDAEAHAKATKILDGVKGIADQFVRDRRERQRRRELVQADFDALRDVGYLLLGAPVEMGGIWEGTGRTTRPACEILRTLARGDSSVALVSSLHPAVTPFWLPPHH